MTIIKENQMDGCLRCQNGTAKDPQARWRNKRMDAPPPRQAPLGGGTPPAPPHESGRTQSSETEGVQPGYVYIHTPLPCTDIVYLDPYVKDRMCDTDFIPDLLTDEGPCSC